MRFKITVPILSTILSFALSFSPSKGFAQKINLEKGHYLTVQKDSISGYFDLEFLNNNKINFARLNDPTTTQSVDINIIQQIVLSNGVVILPQAVTVKGKEEKIYITSLMRGKINLYRGFSSTAEEIFFISTDDIPDIKRINRADPKTFLYTYFKDCDKDKRRDIFYNRTSIEQALTYFNQCYKPDVQNLQTTTTKYSTLKLSLGFKPYIFAATAKGKGWFEGDFQNLSRVGVALALRLNLTQSLSLGTGFNTFNKRLVAKDTFILSKSESVYGSKVKGFPKIKYQLFEIPIELNYQFYKVKSSFKPTLSIGATFVSISTPKLESGGYSDKDTRTNYFVTTTGFVKYPFTSYSIYASGAINKTLSPNAYLEFGVKYSLDSEKFNSNSLPPTGDIYYSRTTTVKSTRVDAFFGYFLYLGGRRKA